MSTLLLERPPALEEGFEHGARRRLGGAPDTGQVDAHGRLTLDDLIVGVWEGLAVRATVQCPVCAGPMGVKLSRARPRHACGRLHELRGAAGLTALPAARLDGPRPRSDRATAFAPAWQFPVIASHDHRRAVP